MLPRGARKRPHSAKAASCPLYPRKRTFADPGRLEPSSRASIDAVATRSDHAFRVERLLDRLAGPLEAWHGLREMQIVIIERRAADEDAAFRNLLRHPAVAGVRPRPLVSILAIKRDDM